MLKKLAQQIETLLKDELEKQPALKEELSWFFQEPGQLQFYDALRAIGESNEGIETVYAIGRSTAKMTVPEVPGQPTITLEIGIRRLESMIKGLKAKIKKVGYGRVEIITNLEQESKAGGWALCRFVEGWLAGAVEQSLKDGVSSSKVACVMNRGKFYFDDGKLKAGPGKEVIFYPKGSRTPKMVDKRSSSGRFKFRGIRFGEKTCVYRIFWKPSFKDILTAIGFQLSRGKSAEDFSAALAKLEEELDLHRRDREKTTLFYAALSEFIRASSTITSTYELWGSAARCLHLGIGFDRIAIFEITPEGLKQQYYWSAEDRDIETGFALQIDPRTPEAEVIRDGKSRLVSRQEQAEGSLQQLSQKWLSPGYMIAPLGEPPTYTHLLWADMYLKKRPPNELEMQELDIVTHAASLALTKLESIIKLEDRVEERTQALHGLTTKLNQMYREMRESETAKSQLLSVVGHELKAPLNSILGLSQLLIKGMDGPLTYEQRQDVEAILKSGERLLRLINDILDLSRLESKRLKLSIHTTDLSEVLREIVQVLEPQAREKGLTFEVSIPDYFKAELDQKRIGQVVTNLCVNAIKYTDKGKVKLSLTEENGEVVIVVEDTGPGIPIPYREKIFEAFYQIDQKKEGGLGLGLTISKRLVELHGGKIEVGESEDKGARFVVKLPRWQNEPSR